MHSQHTSLSLEQFCSYNYEGFKYGVMWNLSFSKLNSLAWILLTTSLCCVQVGLRDEKAKARTEEQSFMRLMALLKEEEEGRIEILFATWIVVSVESKRERDAFNPISPRNRVAHNPMWDASQGWRPYSSLFSINGCYWDELSLSLSLTLPHSLSLTISPLHPISCVKLQSI